ncbi:FimD/PapC N-terminal domain-containing protein [Escherichia coli]
MLQEHHFATEQGKYILLDVYSAVPEGRYYSDIYVNNVWKGKADLQYLRTANTGAPTLCLTPELLSLIDLVKDTMSGNTSCFPASTGLSSARINFDLSTLRLNIEIPQAQGYHD